MWWKKSFKFKDFWFVKKAFTFKGFCVVEKAFKFKGFWFVKKAFKFKVFFLWIKALLCEYTSDTYYRPGRSAMIRWECRRKIWQKCFKLMGFSEKKVTFSWIIFFLDIFLVIASKLVGGFLFKKKNIMRQILSRSDVLKKK